MLKSIFEVTGKVSNGVVTITLNGREMASFDLEGRLLYYSIGNSSYRRSIYNKVYRLEWLENEERIVENIENPEPLIEQAYGAAKRAMELTSDSALKDALKAPAKKTASWLSDDAKRLCSLYDRISIVPPDLYFSSYLQLTTGCSWNLCTFCDLYRGRNYSVKSAKQFSQHVRAVKEYLGKGIEARKRVFLGDANAIDVSQKLLIQVLLNIADELGNPPVYSFIDAFTTPKNLSNINFGELHDLGLKRVYLGLESGSPDVLKILNKPVSLTVAKDFVYQLKGAGVSIAVITLIGVGGYKYWIDHVNMSCALLDEMNFGKGDIVYLSPLVETELYKRLATNLHLGIIHSKQKEKQMEEILELLKKSGKISCPIVRYDIRESFVS